MRGIKKISKTLLLKVSTKGILRRHKCLSLSHTPDFKKKYTWYHAQYIDENLKFERRREKEITNELYIFLFADFRGPRAA